MDLQHVDMSRTRFLVSYDICNPKRLRQVARVLEGFGTRLQFSVFECPLDAMRLASVRAALAEKIHHEEDQVLFVSLGPASADTSLTIEAIGKPYTRRTLVTVI
ncbi:MAG: CRISPR-associated endonuclease Cas2 [Verrucomicrobia bacterium]|nr:CRISPR-associated endonuclease Cas2 [Verrucomicrobiota bacterium]